MKPTRKQRKLPEWQRKQARKQRRKAREKEYSFNSREECYQALENLSEESIQKLKDYYRTVRHIATYILLNLREYGISRGPVAFFKESGSSLEPSYAPMSFDGSICLVTMDNASTGNLCKKGWICSIQRGRKNKMGG